MCSVCVRAESDSSSLSARQWQTTFDALSDGLALIDGGGLVLRANRTFLDSMGFVASEIRRPVGFPDVFESRFDISFGEFLAKSQNENVLELAFQDPLVQSEVQ